MPIETRMIINFSPQNMSNLTLWLDADSVEIVIDKVAQWYDKSGNEFNALQGNASSRPEKVSNILENYPVIRFDGNDYMNSDFGQIFAQPNTMFIAARGLGKSFLTAILILTVCVLFPATKVIVVVSKPPADVVAEKVIDALSKTGKPSVIHFIGLETREQKGNLYFAGNLEEAAGMSVALSKGEIYKKRTYTIITPDMSLSKNIEVFYSGKKLKCVTAIEVDLTELINGMGFKK
jgi:hypothetical protein